VPGKREKFDSCDSGKDHEQRCSREKESSFPCGRIRKKRGKNPLAEHDLKQKKRLAVAGSVLLPNLYGGQKASTRSCAYRRDERKLRLKKKKTSHNRGTC